MYKGINNWNKEKIISHIEKEFCKKSIKKYNGVCQYKSGENRCAVGLFIPTNMYKTDMEAKGNVRGLLENYPNLINFMPLETSALMELQLIHDNSNPETTKQDLINWVNKNVESGNV